MTTKHSEVWTIGAIARRAGLPNHRVEYFVKSRGINPIGTAGLYRIFDERDAEAIVAELKRVDEAREGGLD
jgi:DNA-binding transcriptional MerR regulator